MRGTIRNVTDKGFGFVKTVSGKEYFLHKSSFNGHWDDLLQDWKNRDKNDKPIEVEFDEEKSVKGPRAINCRRLDYPNQAV